MSAEMSSSGDSAVISSLPINKTQTAKSYLKRNTSLIIACWCYRHQIPVELNAIIQAYVCKSIDDKNIYNAVKLWCSYYTRDICMLTYGDISLWDTSNVSTMKDLFKDKKNIGDISGWDTSNVTDMSGMFYSSPHFNQPLGNWNVKKVTNMAHMFHCASHFNQPLEAWEVDNVQDMSHMFHRAARFNQSLQSWSLTHVKNFDRFIVSVSRMIRFQLPKFQLCNERLRIAIEAWRIERNIAENV
jgi:surface protein